MIGAPIRVDHEIGHKVRPRRLDHDVGLPRCAHAAFRIADDPAHSVAGGDGTRADKLLALLECDIGDLSRRRIDLIKRAFGEGIDLDGVDIAGASGLNPRRGVRLRHPDFGIGRFRRLLELRQGFKLPRQRQDFRNLDDLDRLLRLALDHRGDGNIVIGDLGRLEAHASGKRGRSE